MAKLSTGEIQRLIYPVSFYRTKAVHLAPEAQAALEGLGRQALHAYLLAIVHPVSGKVLEFRKELPADLACLRRSFHDAGPQDPKNM
jgi:23S rRNA pseudouridine1911/1915/1917 synthase